MGEWQPIETAREWFVSHGLEYLLEKNTSGTCTWGEVFVWCPKTKLQAEGIYFGKLIDWGDNKTHTHWRDARSPCNESIVPTHWMPLPSPPQALSTTSASSITASAAASTKSATKSQV